MFGSRVSEKRKGVTSGRLTGTAKAGLARGTPKTRAEATYSLYSEDAEGQVVSLHKGLDRCAALLSDILHCENQDGLTPSRLNPPEQDGAVKDAGAKARLSPPTRKKTIRRSVSKPVTNPRGAHTVCRKTSTKPPATPPAHCGVSLHPSLRKTRLPKTPSRVATRHIQSLCPAGPVPAGPAPAGSPVAPDCLPERDQGPGAVTEPENSRRRAWSLLSELKTLMVGCGDSAQTYLRLLEQMATSDFSEGLNPAEQQTLEEHETLPRSATVLQQIQEQEATQRRHHSQVRSLQERLAAADKELKRVQNLLQETEFMLRSREEDNACLKTELEEVRGRLKDTLQDKVKLEETVQQKRHEIEGLYRIIDSCDLRPTPDTAPMRPPGAAKEHVAQYLLSLELSRPLDPLPRGQRSHGGLDVESGTEDWSVQSGSSFTTRDEAAFRDGLAALDASIASLRNTLKRDLVQT